MTILFIPLPEQFKQPWYDGFVAAIDGRYRIRLCDPAKPLADQFQGIDVVVELGGATRNMIDAGLAAGVKLWQIYRTGLDEVDVAYFLEPERALAGTLCPNHRRVGREELRPDWTGREWPRTGQAGLGDGYADHGHRYRRCPASDT